MNEDFTALPDLGLPVWDEDGYVPADAPAFDEDEGVSDTLPVLDETAYGLPGATSARSEAPPSSHGHHPHGGRAAGADPEDLLKGLNDRQREAVIHQGAPLLIMAGAGSGKTRVLTHRIAHLLATGRARAGQILAITFTNKAAAEMRERVAALVGPNAGRMWVSTFHSACVRILRSEHRAAGLTSTFTIYDAQDSQRLIQMVLKAADVDVKRFSVKLVAARISDLKNELVGPAQYADCAPNDPVSKVVASAYVEYQKRLWQANALDFDDLIMRTVQLLQDNPAVAEHYHRRFRHVLVDEYQDTNHAQYVLVRQLVGTGADGVAPAELTVVGDSDQSIYAFRGATIRNIEEFERDFTGARTILLEQNYRSTQNILSAANAVIARNEGRRPKNLWTASGDGALIVMDAADSDRDEARFVVSEIDRLAAHDSDWGDIAVFYRTNSQSRALEELLVRQGIPYRVVGGTRFYERREIKDALAYLQAVSNPDDTVALRRILNVPRRGIGAKAEQALVAHADSHGISFGQALRHVWIAQGRPLGEGISDATGEQVQPRPGENEEEGTAFEVLGLSPRAQKSVAAFWGLLEVCRTLDQGGGAAADVLEEILDRTGYLAELRRSEDPQDASRVENLAELHTVAKDFVTAAPESTLVDFLERVALVADSDQVPAEDARSGQVTLMTVHTAKGLEFPTVFVTGMEDGTFPHQRSLGQASELAEERRLAYVAITRARQRLYLTRAALRSAWGTPVEMPPSRFLDDIPVELVEVRREATAMDRARAGHGYSGGHGSSYGRGSSSGAGGWSVRSTGRDPWGEEDTGAVIGAGTGRRTGSTSMKSGFGLAPRASEVNKAAVSPLTSPSSPKGNGADGTGAGAAGGGSSTGEAGEGLLSLAPGDRVLHRTLGQGTVLGVEGGGPRMVVKVAFSAGEKRLLVRMAPMEKI
ncbi:UvrD-helicase domain-containing protein [Schaalia sp. 19OD2882]|uniref:ATP-dependent helicase n=1 Tax=Schaalia sp. 19OD2882 TaxID=2794089 RepID=UPI001C1EA763|nr:UvrD-helicase domain-containing protein [Schaalia sp. 19OD2882]QWW20021.1 UvrD-helicase domain-containing protein [Schaalia sp. 19OD2882]